MNVGQEIFARVKLTGDDIRISQLTKPMRSANKSSGLSHTNYSKNVLKIQESDILLLEFVWKFK